MHGILVRRPLHAHNNGWPAALIVLALACASSCAPQSNVNSCNGNSDCVNGRVCANGICVLVTDSGEVDGLGGRDTRSAGDDLNAGVDISTERDAMSDAHVDAHGDARVDAHVDARVQADVRADTRVYTDTFVSSADLSQVTEICNGVDDNGNQQIDETFECPQGSSDTCTTSCQSQGNKTCSNDCNWGDCVPPAEVCDGLDNNCDGHADETFACVRGSDDDCTTSCGSVGTAHCNNNCAWNSCEPPADICNGSDEDCDGTPDNGDDCVVAVYRFLCGADHAYFDSPTVPAGCIAEGGGAPVWYNYAEAVAGDSFTTTPLYNLVRASPPDHILVTGEAGLSAAQAARYVLLGNIGHCTQTHISGFTTPLYRLYNTVTGEHFYTISTYERDNALGQSYVSEGVQCQVWAP